MKNSNSIYLAIIILVSFLTFYGQSAAVSWDMGWYITHGLNIALDKGYVGTDQTSFYPYRGPLFPWFISIALKINNNYDAAFWVIRIFAVMLPILLFYLGQQLVDSRVGFSAVMIYLTSWAVNYSSFRHLDAVWPFFVILSWILLWDALKEDRWLTSSLSAISLASAYLVKETAILFLLSPVFFWLIVPQFRKLNKLGLVILNLMIILVCLMPWYVYSVNQGSHFSILGKIGAKVIGLQMTGSHQSATESPFQLESVVQSTLKTVKYIFWGQNNSLFQVLPSIIAAAMIIGWFITGFLMFSAAPNYRIIMLGLFLTYPLVHINAYNNWRLGHNLPFYQFSCLAVGILIHHLSTLIGRIANRFSGSITVGGISSLLLVVLIAVNCIVPNRLLNSNATFLSGNFVSKLLGVQDKNKRVDYFKRSDFSEIISFLEERLNENSAVMVDSVPRKHPLYFYLRATHRVYSIPQLYCYPSGLLVRSEEVPLRITDQLLFFKMNRIFSASTTVFQGMLLRSIETFNISHLITTGNFGESFEDFLNAHPGYSLIFSTKPNSKNIQWKVWRIHPEQLTQISHPTILSNNIARLFMDTEQTKRKQLDEIFNWHQKCFDADMDDDKFDGFQEAIRASALK